MRHPICQDQELLDYLILLRFGPNFDFSTPKPLLNIASIAKLMKKPAGTISRLLKLALLLSKLNQEAHFK
jgi:hypothetical protein